LPTSPPQLAKVVCPGLGTQRPGQAIERWWWKGSGAKVDEANGYGSTPNEVTGGQASGGVRGGVADPVMVDPSTQMRTTEQMELVRARAVDKRGGVRFGLTLTALSPRPPFILSTQTLSHRGPWPATWAAWLGHSLWSLTWATRPCGLTELVAGPFSFKETDPLWFLLYLFSIEVCSFNLNLNLV
jgi:hypothetical protein